MQILYQIKIMKELSNICQNISVKTMEEEVSVKYKVKGETKENSKSCLTCDCHGVQGKLKVCCPFCNKPDGLSRIHKVLEGKCQLLASVLDTVNALVVVLDKEGKIIGFNKSCEKATGYCFNEVKGRNIFDLLLVSEEVDSVKVAFNKIKNGYFPNKNENYWLTKQGLKRRITWSNTALTDTQGKVQYIIATGKDLTDQRAAEDELQNAIHQYHRIKNSLKESEKLAAIGLMSAGITHEIKNPLTVIQGFAQLIE
ncbi:PAS domain S-box-containing protein [Desulforamulus aeronauticus DSM 10349]|uniref:histidine kinase n=1 Tax=Desulforamulus aeronauticus DSM 10349 TaxID=1121421 RepID=A0A1M6X4T7_9FIRM|nr:PAS domain S-box-containing protein [Desulforamulus aeronauticus DSM 10349]